MTVGSRLAVALLGTALLGAGAGTPPGTADPNYAESLRQGYERLSDERTLSRWGYANLALRIRDRPARHARVLTGLRFRTEDRQPEIYLVLRRYVGPAGDEWLEVRIPGRPNGRTGWIPREGLSDLQEVRTHLIVDLRRLRATLYALGKPVFSAPIGIGTRSTPTPAGSFYVRERLRGMGPMYGPVAFGTSGYSSKLTDWPGGGVIGIHGTNRPELIPGRPSHGCVRLRNRDIVRLARLMPVGTPVSIR
jgi:hypothetical protein